MRKFVLAVSPAPPSQEKQRPIGPVEVLFLGFFCADVVLAYGLLPSLLFEGPVMKVAFEVLSLVLGGGAIIAKPEALRKKLYSSAATKSFRLLVLLCFIPLGLMRLSQVPIYSIQTQTETTMRNVCVEPIADADDARNTAASISIGHSFECAKNMQQAGHYSIKKLRVEPQLISVSYEDQQLPYMYHVRSLTLAKLSVFGGKLDLRAPQKITVAFDGTAGAPTLWIKRVSHSNVDFLGPLAPGCNIEDIRDHTIRCEITANSFPILPYGSYQVTAQKNSQPCSVTPAEFSLPGEVTVRYTCP